MLGLFLFSQQLLSEESETDPRKACLEQVKERLGSVDLFLRLHESLQAVTQAVKERCVLDAVQGLEHVQNLLGEAQLDGDDEVHVFKVCLQHQIHFRVYL